MTLSKETAFELYRKILFIRKCEKRICAEYSKDEMKTPMHLCVGAEAIAAGVAAALPKESKVFGTYRNHGIYLAMADECDEFFAELYGKTTGCAGGKAGSMHLASPGHGLVLTSAVVATTIPVAVGAALANQYLGNKNIVAVFFGDGAVEEGAFWESLNFASLKGLRILFVCEDNDLAIHTPARQRQGFRSIEAVVKGFKCHYATAKGYLPGEVFKTAREQIEEMERDSQPGFCYFPYFRFFSHVGVDEDFNAGYRAKPSEEQLKEMDPLNQAEKLALANGIKKTDLDEAGRVIDERIEKAVRQAQADPFPQENELFLKEDGHS